MEVYGPGIEKVGTKKYTPIKTLWPLKIKVDGQWSWGYGALRVREQFGKSFVQQKLGLVFTDNSRPFTFTLMIVRTVNFYTSIPSDCPLWLGIPSTIVLDRPVWLKTNTLLLTTFDYSVQWLLSTSMRIFQAHFNFPTSLDSFQLCSVLSNLNRNVPTSDFATKNFSTSRFFQPFPTTRIPYKSADANDGLKIRTGNLRLLS